MISMIFMKIFSILLLFLHILSISTVTAQDASKNIYDNIAKSPQLFALGVTLNMVPKFIDTISSAGPYTFFAPNNNALETINSTPAEIEQILNLQLVPGKLLSDGFNSISYPKTMHIGPNAIKQPIVVEGAKIRSGWKSASIILPDQVASNGVIHIVDGVLGLPMNPMDTLLQNENLSIFVNSLKNPKFGNLSDEIAKIYDAGGGITILVPTNDAVLNVPKDILSKNELVNPILSYHIIPKQILYTGLLDNVVTAETLKGEMLTFTRDGSDIYVGNVNLRAKITMTQSDILAYNGVIHVVDTVLLPLSIPIDQSVPISPTGSLPPPPPPITTTSTSISPTSSPVPIIKNPTLNIGIMIGSALGGIFGGGALILGGFFLYRKYTDKKRKDEELFPYYYDLGHNQPSTNSQQTSHPFTYQSTTSRTSPHPYTYQSTISQTSRPYSNSTSDSTSTTNQEPAT